MAISSITRMEIEDGLALNAERARKLAPVLDAFFAVTHTVAFERADAQAAAAIRAALKRTG
ncbi:MAG: hypothetical protein RL695_246 [Pseudomonadota bacterium]